MEIDRRDELVRQRAYEIWEIEGRPDGGHERHWQQAEAEIEAMGAGSAAQYGNPGPEMPGDRPDGIPVRPESDVPGADLPPMPRPGEDVRQDDTTTDRGITAPANGRPARVA